MQRQKSSDLWDTQVRVKDIDSMMRRSEISKSDVIFNEKEFTLERQADVLEDVQLELNPMNKQADSDDTKTSETDNKGTENVTIRRSSRERKPPVRFGYDEYIE